MPDPVEIDILFPDPIINDIVVDRLGPPGASGVGVPVGGTTNQRLAKASNTDYDTQWVDPLTALVSWGDIAGTLSNQADLQTQLDTKVPTSRTVNGHALSSNVTITFFDLSNKPQFYAEDYGAVGNGSTDDTTAIQSALTAAGVAGGSVQLLAKQYKVAGTLSVPADAQLIGSSAGSATHNENAAAEPLTTGTTLVITGGSGTSESATATITVANAGAVRGLKMYWPNQSRTAVTPTAYPYAIRFLYVSGADKSGLAQDIELVNAYNGIDIQTGRVTLDKVFGQPLNKGVRVDTASDTVRLNNVHFNPYWAYSTNAYTWQKANGVAFDIRRADQIDALSCFAMGYNIVLWAHDAGNGSPYGNFVNFHTDDSNYGIKVDSTNFPGLRFTNCGLYADTAYIVQSGGTLSVVNSSLWGGASVKTLDVSNGTYLRFTGNVIFNAAAVAVTVTGAVELRIHDNTWTQAGRSISVTSALTTGSIIGNTSGGSIDLAVSPMASALVKVDLLQQKDQQNASLEGTIRHQATWAGAGSYAFTTIDSGSYSIVSGDTLEYDVFIADGSPSYTAYIDITTGAGSLRDQTVYDQKGRLSAADITALALGNWYSRKIALTPLVGSSTTRFDLVQASEVAGTSSAHFRRIRVMNGNTVKRTVWNGGSSTPNTPSDYLTNGASSISTTPSFYSDADLITWAGITPGTGVGTALGVNVGSAGAFVVNGGSFGTPSSGTLTNATGLPITGITSSTSAQLRTLLSDENGTGVALFDSATNPTLTGATIDSGSLTLQGNQSAAAWTTSGIRLKGISGTLTDTTSSGTVAAAYTNKLGGNTIAASSATTFTNYISGYFSEPVAGTNVTLTNKWGLGADSLYVGTSNPVKITSAGILSATNPVFTTPDLGTPSALVGTNITGTATAFNINGTVGATTPAAGTFTTGQFNGVATVGTGGAATDGQLAINGGTNTGQGSYVRFQRGGTTKAFFGTSSAVLGDNSDDLTLSSSGSSSNVILNPGTSGSVSIRQGTLAFAGALKSTTALATPSALSATQATMFASTVSGSSLMGYGTTNDVSLMNRAGTVCLGVGPNTTVVNIPGSLVVPMITAQTTTDLSLNAGSSGATLVLGQGSNGAPTLTAQGTGDVNLTPGNSGSNRAVTISQSLGSNGRIKAQLTNTNTGGSAQLDIYNNNAAAEFVIETFGSAQSGTVAGITKASLTQVGTAAAKPFLFGTFANDSLYFATNSAVVGRWYPSGGLYIGSTPTDPGANNGKVEGTWTVTGSSTLTGAVTQTAKTTTYNNIVTVGNGVPSELATIDSTGLTANVAASTFYAVPASGAGLYRVSAYLVTTTAASVSSTMPNAQVVYTDSDSNTSVTLDVSPILGAAGLGQSGLLTANTIGTVFSGTVVIYVKASTTIQYQTVNYASTAAGMAYALRMKLEAL